MAKPKIKMNISVRSKKSSYTQNKKQLFLSMKFDFDKGNLCKEKLAEFFELRKKFEKEKK